jgi:acyl-CoA hydrolase
VTDSDAGLVDRRLAALVRRGARIALADGCGTPHALHAALTRAAAAVGEVSLVLGWTPAALPDLGFTAFRDVRCLVGGPGVREAMDAGVAHLTPCRISAVPALLAGPLRPDLVVATVVRDGAGLRFGSEVSWMRGLLENTDVPVAAVVSRSAPRADAGGCLPDGRVEVLGEVDGVDGEPQQVPTPSPRPDDRAVAQHVAGLVPEGARLQIGPGRLAAALLAALRVPVGLDSGLLPEQVVDLDERGLLLGVPTSAYLVGTRRLYDWADGRRVLHPIEVVHDVGRLSAAGLPPLVAVNTALEIDLDGQVNVEGVGSSTVGMIGGHPDFAAAAARSIGGLSVVALVSTRHGRPTLVERLSRPVTTASHDVQVVATERGVVDLRGLGRAERRSALVRLWGGEVVDRGSAAASPRDRGGTNPRW